MAFAGCSSFAAWGPNSHDGDLIIGRNLDNPLNGYIDAFPLVTYFEPNDGQRYLSLGTAGLYPPSLTAMNESGIYLAAHLIPTEETSFEGTPMYFVVNSCFQGGNAQVTTYADPACTVQLGSITVPTTCSQMSAGNGYWGQLNCALT